MITIAKTICAFENEPLSAPFGFKGGSVNGLWQVAALLVSDKGHEGLGVGVQSTLWSDAAVFAANAESVGNAMMFQMTEHALKLAQGQSFDTPLDLLDRLLPAVHEFGKCLTGRADLRLTFALNSLVAVDNAAWMLYARETGKTSFDDLIPAKFRSTLGCRHDKLACIPLFTYGVGIDQIRAAVDQGFFFAKIKVGADPDQDGNRDKMLDWDQRRLSEIHALLKDRQTPWTVNGRIPYYLDANGRYDTRDRLMRLLDHADRIGALERIVLFEEPFPEECEMDVHGIPVRLAADESAHSEADVRRRIDLGYGAIALKPIAKTLSMSLRIARVAHEAGVPCFCADLTVCPWLVDWNKTVAARLPALPGLNIGVLESNGRQNYRDWKAMIAHHPAAGATWIDPQEGLFHLGGDFYERNAGILEMPRHYREMVR